jgi:energy-coupling factor transporter ATP-binding protein EcfA2
MVADLTVDDLVVPRVEWPTFRRSFARRFQKGHHVFVVGPNGSGKSVLVSEIVRSQPKRNWMILDAKGGDDPSLDMEGFERAVKWPHEDASAIIGQGPLSLMDRARRALGLDELDLEPERDREPRHVRLAPPIRVYEDLIPMRKYFDHALRDAFVAKGEDVWSVVIDEAQIIADPREGMGLGHRIAPFLRTKRYHGASMVLATQYPVWIPKSSHGEARHRFFFRLYEHERLQGAGEIAGDRKRIPAVIQALRPHEFLYQDAFTRKLVVSRVD